KQNIFCLLTRKPTKEARTKPLTDYFPVRRSERRPHTALMKDKVKEIEEAILKEIEEGFEVKEFIDKGRGLVTTKNIKQGEFVLEYCGDLICLEEAKKREKMYEKDDSVGCYMYYFSYKNNRYCVDATKESGRLARLVNHSKHGNLKTKSFSVQGIPRLILVAKRDIQPGEELLYDYGDRNKYSLQSHPWLAL
ncbi:N-lysine methyltransferase KMT5A-like, partial [Limulus polyphemus]|uniref:[histone H4]-lysine(20) N-methyltransferase n=1 Tax=Limulus polyphemus TaxID=6850 RepID=A0ABM1BTJ8_LIMPO